MLPAFPFLPESLFSELNFLGASMALSGSSKIPVIQPSLRNSPSSSFDKDAKANAFYEEVVNFHLCGEIIS